MFSLILCRHSFVSSQSHVEFTNLHSFLWLLLFFLRDCLISGSPNRVARPPRSRSAGGQDSPSPQQSPFRRNVKANQSARQSPTHHAVKHSTSSSHATRNYNTWNSSSRKKRPTISEDTFCQQVAEIMQQYAAMMPSPRKDSKPDSRISTRIPAPVPVHRT